MCRNHSGYEFCPVKIFRETERKEQDKAFFLWLPKESLPMRIASGVPCPIPVRAREPKTSIRIDATYVNSERRLDTCSVVMDALSVTCKEKKTKERDNNLF